MRSLGSGGVWWVFGQGLRIQHLGGAENWKSENLTDMTTRRQGYSLEFLEGHGKATGCRVRRVEWCFVDLYRDVPTAQMSP